MTSKRKPKAPDPRKVREDWDALEQKIINEAAVKIAATFQPK